jgi:hypothetical protein
MNADGTIVGDDDSIAAKALAAAIGEIGVTEDPIGSNRGARVDEYQAPTGLPPGEPWCASFACWCDREAGGSLPYLASVAALWRAVGARALDKSYDPQPGWLAVFGRAGQNPLNGGDGHIGRVVSASDSAVTTIDGNHNNAVAQATRPRSEVLGWISY